MSSRLSLWCERLIEAGWLVTLLIIPLFFQTTTARVFEPDKMMVVRSIALLMLVAWLVRALDRRLGAPVRTKPSAEAERSVASASRGRWALVWPVGLTLAATLIATAGSIAPYMSWLGSYQRGQGFVSLLAFVVVFGSLLFGVRRRDQVERMVTVLLLGSIPAAIFPIMQWLGIQPGVWRTLYGGRVFGTLGNPIFLGGYLLMIIPLTLARLARPNPSSAPEVGVLRGLYGIALLLQGVAFVLTLSRGPWLGLAVGLAFLGLAWAATYRRRGLAVGIVAVTIVLVAGLGVLNLPAVRDNLTTAPEAIRRLSQVLDFSAGSTGAVRVTLWDAAARVMTVQPLRLPIGYGPETGLITLTANASYDLRYQESPDVSPDRAHNESFDRLIETGLLGLIGYLWLVAAGIYLIVRRLGLGGDGSGWLVYGLVVGVGTAAGGVLPYALGAPAFMGIGLTVGLLAGVWIYLLMEALTGAAEGTISRENAWLLVALLAAFVGHFVEIAVGPPNPATRLLFWAFLGVVGALGGLKEWAHQAVKPRTMETTSQPVAPARRKEPAAVAVPAGGPALSQKTSATAPVPASSAQRAPARRPAIESAPVYLATSPLAYGGLAGLLMATLAYSFVTLDDFSLSANGFAIVWFLGLTLLLGGTLLWAETQREAKVAGTPTPTRWPIIGLMLGGLVVLLLVRGLVLVAGGDTLAMLWLYAAILLASLALIATWLPRAGTPQKSVASGGIALYVPLALGALVLMITLNFVPITADMYLRTGEAYAEANDPQTSLRMLAWAMNSQLNEPVYAQKLAETLTSLAQASPTQEQRDEGFDQAAIASELAASKRPVDANYRYNVGNVFLLWGQATQDQTLRTQRLAKAGQNFQQATEINPNLSDAYVGWGLASMLSNQTFDASQALLLKALEVDPRNAQAYFYLGRLYQSQSQMEAAERAYLTGLQLAPASPQAVTAYSALGDMYQKANRVEEAIQMTLKAVELTPNNWINHLNLGLLYQRVGRIEEALNEAQLAYNLAPEEARQRVVDIIGQMRQPSPVPPPGR